MPSRYLRPRSNQGIGPSRAFRFAPRIAMDGDSIIAQTSYGFGNRYIADTPDVTMQNFSVAGACIAATENASNNLEGRIATIATFNPTILLVAIGTNDLKTLDAATFESRYLTYITNVRAAMPHVLIVVCGIGPTQAYPAVNTQRASANPTLRSWVGSNIDAYLPRGEHPIYDTDTAGANTTWYSDGEHPGQVPHRAYWQMIHDVLDPYLAQATATSPATVPLANIADAPTSTACTMRGRVTGMKLGQSATMTTSGPTTAVGLGAFDATSKTVMNGDVVQATATSSASNNTAVSGTITMGSKSLTWSITTRVASYTATAETLDPAFKYSGVTLSNGNLTATGAAGVGAFQLARGTAPTSGGKRYFEMRMGAGSGTSGAKLASVHDATVNHTGFQVPGSTTAVKDDGVSVSGPGSLVVYNGGVTVVSALVQTDYLPWPTITDGAWIGVAVDEVNGIVWVCTASGTWLMGDPTVADGGFKIAAPLASYYYSAAPKLAEPQTVNYDGIAVAFQFSVPLGFRPKGVS